MSELATIATSSGDTAPQIGKLIDRRHPEWRTHQLRWRWLLDTWEGGEAYRQGIYGWDLTGLPIRNLIRHKREYPDPREQNYYGVLGRPAGSDQFAQATNDDYEWRRAMTPIPTFMSDTIERHLSKIHSQPPKRDGSPDLLEWWEDVDGSSTPIDDWMRDTIEPLLMTLGQLDVIMDHPALPKNQRASVKSKADQRDLDVGSVIADYILPENMVWWDLDTKGRYVECLVCEPQESKGPMYRHWLPDRWELLDAHGDVKDRGEHPYGRIPIIRVFDRRRPRAKNVGLPRYEAIAEITRAYYNKDSELALSDANQAHPLLMAPEDVLQADSTIPIGPSNLVPKVKVQSGPNIFYESFEVLEFPKEGAESIRINKNELAERADKSALLTKPAGASGTTGTTVSQSGVSKRLDTEDGNALLSRIASVFERVEIQIAELFFLVKSDGSVDKAAVEKTEVCYAKDFDLYSPDELSALIADFQAALTGAGSTPLADAFLLKRLLRLMLPGLEPDEFAELDDEIDEFVARQAKVKGQEQEASLVEAAVRSSVIPGEDTAGTSSQPDNVNAASLAASGVLVSESY